MDKQTQFDNAVLLQTIKQLLEQEQAAVDKTHENVNAVGKTVLSLSDTVIKTNDHLVENEKQLNKMIESHTNLLNATAEMTDKINNADKNIFDTQAFKTDMLDLFNKTFENHQGDKQELFNKIDELYAAYTNQLIEVSNKLTSIQDTLLDEVAYSKLENTITSTKDELTTLTNDLVNLNDEYKQSMVDVNEHFDYVEQKIMNLLDKLNDINKNALTYDYHIAQLSSRIDMMSARLQALAELNGGE